MDTKNAIKKLEKKGFEVKKTEGGMYVAKNPNLRHFIQFYDQEGRVIIIDLRTPGQEDDIMSDYHAGTFCDNITQAIRYATTW